MNVQVFPVAARFGVTPVAVRKVRLRIFSTARRRARRPARLRRHRSGRWPIRLSCHAWRIHWDDDPRDRGGPSPGIGPGAAALRMSIVSLCSGPWNGAHREWSPREPIFEVHDMPRIVRLSALAVWSMALLPLGLSGCDTRPADGSHVQINEDERKQAMEKMRSVMDTRKMPKASQRSHRVIR